MPVENEYKPVIVYRRRDLKPQQIIFCEAYLANGFNAVEAAKVAGYKSPAQNAHLILKRKAVQKYLKNKANKLEINGINYDYKLRKLRDMVECATDNYDESKDVSHVNAAMKAIEILNVMQGDNAPVKSQSVNVTIKDTAEKLKDARKQYEDY